MLYTAYVLVRKIIRDIILIVVVTSLVITYFIFRQNAYPVTEVSDRTPETLKFTYELANFASTDNVALKGWFIPAKEKQESVLPATIIVLHGQGLTKADSLDWAHFLHDQYNLLLLDFRGHGASQKKASTYGYFEAKDVVGAIEYLKTRGDVDRTRIGVFGYELGANAGILAAAITADVRAIVADSPFDRFDRKLDSLYSRYWIMQKPLAWLTGQWFRFLARTNSSKFQPADSIRYTTAPSLFIAPENDAEGSAESCRAILEKSVAKDSEIWTVPGNYSSLFFNNREEYKKRVLDFFEKHL